MTSRVGPHFFYGKVSTGFEGKSFIAFGGRVMEQVFLANMLERSEVATRVNLGARRTSRTISEGSVSVTVTSDASDYLARFRNRMRFVILDSLQVAGSSGVEAARAEYARKTPRSSNPIPSGKNSWGTNDPDTASNLTYEIVETGNIFGVTLKPIANSVRLAALEFGLYGVGDDRLE